VYGNICDVEYFDALRSRGIRVLYDSAHAFGVRRRGVTAGAWGDAEVFSLHATKILNACEGGVVTTLSPDLAKKVKLLTNFGILNELEVDCVGTNAKMSEVHALFGLHSLRHLEGAIHRRLHVIEAYSQAFLDSRKLQIPVRQTDVQPNGQYFPILLETQATRDQLYDFLKEKEAFARKYFFPIAHRLKPYRHLAHADLKISEDISDRVLCLPLNSLMLPEDARHVAALVHDFLQRER
jgi:dTDP-4-amino-4,6-dideoxygalactose transaminase